MACFRVYVDALRADLYRNRRATGLRAFVRCYLRKPGFRYLFWMRTVGYLAETPVLWCLYRIGLFQLHRLQIKYGISIPHVTRIGPGFCIGHFGGIVVNGSAVIGRNCNIGHGVTIAQKNRGRCKGCPTIGDMVYIGPGSCILGGISVGSNVVIGAHAVVVHDVGDDEVVVGNPAKTISKDGARDYVNYTLSEDGEESEVSGYEGWRSQLSAWHKCRS